MPRLPRKRPIDYILPFLIMICAGIIIVLGYQLWSVLNNDTQEEEIYMYVAQGSARILPWGAGEWDRAFNGTRLLQGDAIKTQRGGRVVIELFGDHYVRLDQNTEVVINEVRENGGVYEINLEVRDGNIWVNNKENADQPMRFTVRTNHTLVNTVSTVYEVEQHTGSEVIRVIKGAIQADIFVDEGDGQNQVDVVNVGVGQEAVITEAALRKFAQRETPDVIDALSDSFRESSFYKWNMSEDNNPSDYSVKSTSTTDIFDDEPATEDAEDVLTGPKPEITSPSTNPFTTQESSLTIRGTVPVDATKMMVDATVGGTSETYELNLFIPGNENWSYGVTEAAGTLAKGTNTYKFYFIDGEEQESVKTTLTINYGAASSFDDPTNDDTTTTDNTTDTSNTSSNVNLGTLATPTVDTFNGGSSTTVTTDTVKVVGTASGAETVTVGGYTLQGFSPGDSTWVYYAKESLGNMDPGDNYYTVVATAPDGSTKQTSFSLTYNKPVTDTGATEQAQ